MNTGLWKMGSGFAALLRPGMTRGVVIFIALLLAGCAGAGNWQKPAAPQSAAERDYQDCRELADTAVKTQADIDQDIAATRQTDWQRAGLGRVQRQTMREQTRDRAASIVDSCMRAKGFGPKS